MKTISLILYAVAIWAATCILGSLFLYQSDTLGLDYISTTIISLALSLPAGALLIPNLFIIQSLTSFRHRTVFAIASLALICLVVTLVFLKLSENYPFDEGTQIQILLPYAVSAYLSFFAIARKLLSDETVEL